MLSPPRRACRGARGRGDSAEPPEEPGPITVIGTCFLQRGFRSSLGMGVRGTQRFCLAFNDPLTAKIE